jgi:WD40 repeat protein
MKRLIVGVLFFTFVSIVPAAAQDRTVFLELPHSDVVTALAADTDGRYIISGSAGGVIKIWDAESGYEIRTLAVPGGGDLYLAVSPDGKRFLSSSDKYLIIWELESGKILKSIETPKDRIHGLVYSPDGRRIITASGDTVQIWNGESGALLQTLTGHAGSIRNVAVSSDGRRIASASVDGSIKLWDAATGSLVKTFTDYELDPYRLVFSPDNRLIVSTSFDDILRMWDAVGEETGPGIISTDLVGKSHISFDTDNRLIVLSFFGIVFYDFGTMQKVDGIPRYGGNIISAFQSSNGKRIITYTTSDYGITIWENNDAGTWSSRPLASHTSVIRKAAFGEDNQLYITDWRGGRWRWDFKNLDKVRLNPTGELDMLEYYCQSPDGKKAAAMSSSGDIVIFDLESDKSLTIRSDIDGFYALTFSPNGKYLAAAGADGNTKIWNAETGREQGMLIGHKDLVLAVLFSPDGSRLFSSSRDKTIKIWDAQTYRELKTITAHAESVGTLAFDPGGKYLYSGSREAIKVWDISTWKETRSFDTENSGVYDLTFSPNGKLFVFTGSDYTLRVWDAAAGKELVRIAEISPSLEYFFLGNSDDFELETFHTLITPEGFYFGEDRYLRVRTGGAVYGIEGYRSELMRPDKVREALGVK